MLAEILNLKKYSYLFNNTHKKNCSCCLFFFVYFISYIIFCTKCAHLLSLHKHSKANFRCTCIVLLLSYTGDNRAAFNMPLTSHLYTRIDTWLFIYLFILQKNVYNILSTSLIPFQGFCSNVTMKIGLSLKAFHLLGSIGINLWTVYIKNYMYWKGHSFILGTYIII